jgi:serine/threonine-protein kinase PknK
MAPGVLASPETVIGLPHQVTSFVGRRRDRGQVKQALAEYRLVSLTGFGGIGKTRLALAVAADLRRAFAGGVHFVSLGELADPRMVARGTAAAVGAQPRPGHSVAASLICHLRDQQALLILDSCDQVIEAAAELADKLLRYCPRLRIVVTSREPLRIDGEMLHAVAPLAIPAVGAPATSESVSLFLDRARAVIPPFARSPGNDDDVAEICRQLEGIPLAIELAAARLRSMSASEIARSLHGGWEILCRGSRAAPPRQRTMAACVDWSFGLCSPAERQAWAAISVFTGQFDTGAARAVCSGLTGHADLNEILARLVDKSVVAAAERGGQIRFRMLPPVRDHGLRWLAELGLAADVTRRHEEWSASNAAPGNGSGATEGDPAADAGGAGGDVLTSRQHQVARLVASGLSNRDIADTLVISRRTAETHVENILTRLGYTSRNQIAAWIITQSRISEMS